MSCPVTTDRRAYSRPLASSTWACSLRMTAVVSGGTRAPVAIRTAVPSGSAAAGPRPARSPAPASNAQGPGPATAQPSMAEVSKDGRSVSAPSASASTCPRARSSGNRIVAGGPPAPRGLAIARARFQEGGGSVGRGFAGSPGEARSGSGGCSPTGSGAVAVAAVVPAAVVAAVVVAVAVAVVRPSRGSLSRPSYGWLSVLRLACGSLLGPAFGSRPAGPCGPGSRGSPGGPGILTAARTPVRPARPAGPVGPADQGECLARRPAPPPRACAFARGPGGTEVAAGLAVRPVGAGHGVPVPSRPVSGFAPPAGPPAASPP